MTATAKKRKTEVPGQALGFGLQYTRLTQLLLGAPEGSFCSLEVLDDMAVEAATGEVTLVQGKSALTANPVSDRAKSLWKTFANWMDTVDSGSCNPETTTFEIYVSRPVRGQIVDSFAKAKTESEADTAIRQARKKLWGTSPKYSAKAKLSDEISPFVERVFTGNADRLNLMVRNFQLKTGSGSPQADVEALIRRHPVSLSKVRHIADYLCGVVKRRLDELLEKGLPAVLSRDEFYNTYRSYARSVDRETILMSRAEKPSSDMAQSHMPRVFVRQLDLIELPHETKLGAVNDFLMAAADRTAWAMSGEVDESSLADLNERLKRTWSNKRGRCTLEFKGRDPKEIGQKVYFECMETTAQVQAMTPPEHFVPGCMHHLADTLIIGWHPDYDGRLRENGAK
ncbi:MAG: hypothetical protein J0L92_33900 [Deltaproteobacteria bacterium]|nr:hypothetical protein [Deltaproteobacteria bacterium]